MYMSVRCTENPSTIKHRDAPTSLNYMVNGGHMTRKDFQLIADALVNLRTFEAHDSEMSETVARAVRYSSVVDGLASALATTNARFDRNRFLTACGIGATQTTLPASDGGLKRDVSKIKAARKAIEREDDVCFDVAAEHGQIFGNVKHMKWFAEAVAEAL
jgi:hypothetical protein